MGSETKLMLSADELRAAAGTGLILTKRAVMAAAAELFADIYPIINDSFHPVILRHALPVSLVPKISRGENYLGFPYVMMDLPASFEKENVFVVRTMFWWGHCFSIMLHLSGSRKDIFAAEFLERAPHELFIASGEDEWQHFFGPGNFVPIASLTQKEKDTVLKKSFLKIALQYQIEDWPAMPELLASGFFKMANMLA